jgi:hypothetical protein
MELTLHCRQHLAFQERSPKHRTALRGVGVRPSGRRQLPAVLAKADLAPAHHLRTRRVKHNSAAASAVVGARLWRVTNLQIHRQLMCSSQNMQREAGSTLHR